MDDGSPLLERLIAFVRQRYPLPEHLIGTERWLVRLAPEADEALRAAALLHDVDRLFPLEPGESVPPGYAFDDRESLLWHGRRSARFARRVLEDLGAEPGLVEGVVPLVARHEVGGDERLDALMDADSLSFLESNVGYFLRKITADEASVRRKVDYMFGRIRSAAARELALPLYRRVGEKLDALVPGAYEPDGSLDVTGIPLGTGPEGPFGARPGP